ncbi:MAG: (E)-4-hydroxy-3-methylbut-2-enyl-diphosphate synthase [Rikenellaceae bacterium]|nr:(E)-4-hydroxy-3-methylbut-2-enyl-diphosphate synthase [Rikenellaceae bacterium]
MKPFCPSLEQYTRRQSCEVRIGGVTIGGEHPVAVQSMTTANTLDTTSAVAEIGRIRNAGGRIVRLTAPGRREAENLKNIAQVTSEQYPDVALVADIHFVADLASVAADYVDKVRVNPGNYNDPDGEVFRALIDKCRRRGVSIRVGVNHGSLSSRMVDRYGDTVEGMVASAMEFLRVCQEEQFDQVVVSMKSSNTRVMVEAYRALAAEMLAEGMNFPLHLGVTEAGNDIEGCIKSAVGIGALMADGIGDTIRVSLTEPPENEIPVALRIVEYFEGRASHAPIEKVQRPELYNPYDYQRRPTNAVGRIGGANVPVTAGELSDEERALLGQEVVVLEAVSGNAPAELRARILNLWAAGDNRPVIVRRRYDERDLRDMAIHAALDFGGLFVDGLADGIWIDAPAFTPDEVDDIALRILQASRSRMSRTEYIACPGCGRTLYDLRGTLARIKEATSHLAGVKIGVMGCIVNGPGEMADADYGYVGSGPGRITLYRGREVVRRNIPEGEAIEALVELINEDRK